MSLIVAVKAAAGLVLASDSRTVFTHSGGRDDVFYATRDDKTKVYGLPAPHHQTGLAFCGHAPEHLGDIVAARLPAQRVAVEAYATLVSDVLRDVAACDQARVTPDFGIVGIVAGYDDTQARVFVVRAPDALAPVESHPGRHGVTWGGMREIVDRLLQGYDGQFLPGGTLAGVADDATLVEAMRLSMWIPLDTMSLAACVDLAAFLIRTTIDALRFQVGGQHGVGGAIDLATITPDAGLTFVRRKRATCDGDDPWTWRAVTPLSRVMAVDAPADIRRVGTYTV